MEASEDPFNQFSLSLGGNSAEGLINLLDLHRHANQSRVAFKIFTVLIKEALNQISVAFEVSRAKVIHVYELRSQDLTQQPIEAFDRRGLLQQGDHIVF